MNRRAARVIRGRVWAVVLVPVWLGANPWAWAQNASAQIGSHVQGLSPAAAAAAHTVVNPAQPATPAHNTPAPKILGLTCTQAQQSVEVHHAEVRVNCVAGTAAGQSPGTINRQIPDVGVPVPDNRIVVGYVEPDAAPPPDQTPANIAAPPTGKFKGHRYVVPPLYGQTCKGADALARRSGFPGVKCLAVASDAKVNVGTIFEQKPEAGRVVAKPMVIVAELRKPVARVVVPSVVGNTVRQATITLTGVHLRTEVIGISAAALAVVDTQHPEAKSVVAEGTSVQLTTVIVVPDLTGLRCEAARSLATSYGLAVSACQAHEPVDETSPLGRVYAQEPRAGVRLTADRAVIVQVVAHAVPAVEGERLAQAEGELRARHLTPVPDVATGGEHRLVKTQEPRAGALYETPIRVRLTTIGLAIVPSLQKFSCADAEKLLMAKGLGSDCHADRQWWGVGTPRIYRQSQAAGSELSEGTVIRSQAKAMDIGKVGAVLLALLAAVGTVGLVLRPSMHLSVRPDRAPEVTIREADSGHGDFAGLAVRGEADPDGSPIIRLAPHGEST